MKPPVYNLFSNPASTSGKEEFLTLLRTDHITMERIVSNGECGAEGLWYDQARREWVVLLKGTATLEFEGGEMERLVTGDCLLIEAHVRHRVAEVSLDAMWLAVHFT